MNMGRVILILCVWASVGWAYLDGAALIGSGP